MMTGDSTTTTADPGEQATARFSAPAWRRANAIGLCITFALFALVGEGMEELGAEHGTLAWGVPALAAMFLGGTLFARLRSKALGTPHPGRRGQAVAIGVGLTAGFVVGFAAPLDFILGILAGGTIGGALQLRDLRRKLGRSRRLLLVGVGAWLLAGLVAIGTAILLADVILVGALGLDDAVDGAGGFVAILALVGLVGGTIGGAIEGAALLRRERVGVGSERQGGPK